MIQIAPWKKILTLIVVAFGFLYAAPNMVSPEVRGWAVENLPSWTPNKTINLGLDLRGGAHLLYAVDVDVVFGEQAELLRQDVSSELRKARIARKSLGSVPNGIRLKLADAADGEAARKIIRKGSANLQVNTSENGTLIEAVLNEVGVKALYDQTISQSIEIVRRRIDELGTTEPVIQRQGDDRILIQAPGADSAALQKIIGKTAKLTFHLVAEDASGAGVKNVPSAEQVGLRVPVERRAMLTGDMLTNAQPSFNQGGQPVVSFSLDRRGAKRFCDVTRKHTGKPFAIVLDNEVLSAPNINEPICGGQAQISGSFTLQEVNDLSILLRAGALPAPMAVIEERTVGPSLGADSVAAGKIASVIALVAVLVFMGATYGGFGMMANVALVANVALLFALLSSLQATLTLPGIAGIVLTIGMAVDANVLIFERIREEIRAGRSAVSAVDAGYRQAMSTIVDSNLTTLIAAAILFSFGTGPIKGFSVTLGLGIMTSFFTAIMVTRVMVVAYLQAKRPKVLPI
ncbi:MAG: protein translocase subunit SecD [Alphaproteobacteria bacterium]